jgi:DNA-binding CsgD family transcriptional regulator
MVSGLSIFDSHGRCLWVSQELPELRGKVTGKSAWHWCPSQHDKELLIRAFALCAFTGEPQEASTIAARGRRFNCKLAHIPHAEFVGAWQMLPERMVKLTVRERQILDALCNDEKREQTAKRLGISPRTVESFRLILRRKTGAKGIAGLVKWALRMGLCEP